MADNKTLKAACAYLARGLGVFPLNGKVPTTEHGVKDASYDLGQIEEWFPIARNIAIAIPPGVVVVDVDPRNGGMETFNEWCAAYGWPEGVPEAHTGGGGMHYWFKFEDRRRLKKNPGAGVDLLTHGRYVVAPPSSTTDVYRWVVALPADLDDLPELPGWLLQMATIEERATPSLLPTSSRISSNGDALDEAAHAMTSWAGLLTRHGWQYVGGGFNEYADDGTKWRHPTSDNPFSATIKHGCLFVYSPNTPFPVTESGDPHGVTLFSALEILDYGGDRKRCLQALRDAGYLPELAPTADAESLFGPPATAAGAAGAPLPVADATVAVDLPLGVPIDWPALWLKDDDLEQRWLSEPIIARGRAHALYAPAKVGKSLFMLQLCAALATGRPFLDKPAHDPIPVLYADYEMTDDDVRERLEGFGYGPDDLTLLHYFLLSSGHGLDTPQGGDDLVVTAERLQVGLVVVDTTARAIAGAENDADTLRAFYRFTGARLKRHGIAWQRLDHSGKDALKGQRGTSAKNDDVDLVWRMTALDAGHYKLEATHQRMGWVERDVKLTLKERGDVQGWERTTSKSYPDRTKETADLLDKLGAPFDITKRDARELLKAEGWKGRDNLIIAAFSWRKTSHAHELFEAGTTAGTTDA